MTVNDPMGVDTVQSDRVFVLRFWIERLAAPDAPPVWRAKVRDLSSGEEKHVHGVQAALDHVRRALSTAREPDSSS